MSILFAQDNQNMLSVPDNLNNAEVLKNESTAEAWSCSFTGSMAEVTI